MRDDPHDPRIPETDGRNDLVAWLAETLPEGAPRRTAAGLARQLGVSAPAVRQWECRLSRPTEGPLRDALCRLIGSDPSRWITTEDRATAERLATIGVDA